MTESHDGLKDPRSALEKKAALMFVVIDKMVSHFLCLEWLTRFQETKRITRKTANTGNRLAGGKIAGTYDEDLGSIDGMPPAHYLASLSAIIRLHRHHSKDKKIQFTPVFCTQT